MPKRRNEPSIATYFFPAKAEEHMSVESSHDVKQEEDAIDDNQQEDQPLRIRKPRKTTADFEAESKLMQEKLDAHLAEGHSLDLQTGSKFEDGKILMQCNKCGEFQPRNTIYFDVNTANFATCRPGFESLHHSISHPCKACRKANFRVLGPTTKGFIQSIFWRYPSLNLQWFEETLKKQGGKGPISNMTLNLQAHVSNAVGIHRRNNALGHVPANCVLEVQEMNAQQQEAIPCLFAAWFTIYTELARRFGPDPDLTDYVALFRHQYNKTPKELGFDSVRKVGNEYDVFRSQYHFKTILSKQIMSHILADVQRRAFILPSNRAIFANLVYQKAIAKLESQFCRCAFSGIGLTHLREYNQMSFERKDNSLPHFDQDGELSNCVFICRIFNSSKQLSPKMILEYFLHQTMVPITEEVRAKATAAFDAM
jgi:hypothetical protein